jgi:hypothetical protein
MWLIFLQDLDISTALIHCGDENPADRSFLHHSTLLSNIDKIQIELQKKKKKKKLFGSEFTFRKIVKVLNNKELKLISWQMRKHEDPGAKKKKKEWLIVLEIEMLSSNNHLSCQQFRMGSFVWLSWQLLKISHDVKNSKKWINPSSRRYNRKFWQFENDNKRETG